jgi:hypothetical protein
MKNIRTCWISGVVCILSATGALAQSSSRASVVWGTVGGLGAGDGSTMHANDGVGAGQVNAAKSGALLGSNITVSSIGVQNIISVTGTNNTLNSSQGGTNTGSISNSGSVTVTGK